MKLKLALCVIVAFLSVTTKAFADPDPNFWVFICFGQSNMESGGAMNQEDRTVDKRFQVMADFDNTSRGWKKGNWYTATPPLAAKGSGICMVDYFGRTMVANLPENIRIGVIKVSVPGTKIELFEKDTFQKYLDDAGTADWLRNAAKAYSPNPYQYMVDQGEVGPERRRDQGVPAAPGRIQPQ